MRLQNMLVDLIPAGAVIALTLAFLAVMALLLWPAGQLALAGQFALGFAALWLATPALSAFGRMVSRLFRMNVYDRANAYIAFHLICSGALILAWVVYTASTLHAALASFNIAAQIALILAGAVAVYLGQSTITVFYAGTIYALAVFALAVVGYGGFVIWLLIG
jgi:hypothetical protein